MKNSSNIRLQPKSDGSERERRYEQRRSIAAVRPASTNTRQRRNGDARGHQGTAVTERSGSQSHQQHPYHPNGRFHMMGNSPLALTPTLSPMYQLGHAQTASASAAVSNGVNSATGESIEETIGRVFTTCLPGFFDALAKYQYQQALAPLEFEEPRNDWKQWDAFQVMMKLAASCESTYHLMKYLDTEMVSTDTIDKMYRKLVVLLNHLAADLKPLVIRQQHLQFGIQSSVTPSNDSYDSYGFQSSAPASDLLMCGDLGYYEDLLEQSAAFFGLRVPMINIYRGMIGVAGPRNYAELLQKLDGLLMAFDAFDHPLLDTIKLSALEEVRTVHAAVQCEIRITQYDFTKSMIALHRLKSTLRSWSDHIDGVSDYPMFDDLGEEIMDDQDSLYSSSRQSNQSFLLASSQPSAVPINMEISMSRNCSERSSRSNTPDPLTEQFSGEEPVKRPSIISIQSMTSTATEAQNTLTRLLSQSSLLKRGLSVSNLPLPRLQKGLVQKPGDPYASFGGASSTPTDVLEQVILGGGVTPSGGNATTANGGGPGNPLAAELIASSVKKQERDDGFALPVYQWSKRFYRSLVAKFTLYFYNWLHPFEKQSSDFLSMDLTRFIRTPVGISYLQFMDVFLARGSYRADDGSIYIMLILETDQLENKGAHYYQNGYLCPSTSKSRDNSTANDDGEETSKSSSKNLSPLMSPRRKRLQRSLSSGQPLFVLKERGDEQSDFEPLWGLRSWPAVFCYPRNTPPLRHWPNIVSLIMDNRTALHSTRPVFHHAESRMKVSYYITRVDLSTYLVVVLDGKKRPSEKMTQDFMQTLTESFQHCAAFDPKSTIASSTSSM